MVEKILLRGGPIHMQVNEILGLGSKVGKTGKGRMNIGLRREVLSEGFLSKELSKGDTPHFKSSALEELAA